MMTQPDSGPATGNPSADIVDGPVGDDAASCDAPERRRLTSAAAGILGVIAVVGLLCGVLGFWTMRTATDSERFERRVEELLVTEEVSNSLARRIVNEVVLALDVKAAIDDVVPDVIEPVTDVLLAGVRTRVEVRVGELIRTEEVAEAVAAAAATAHSTAIDVLRGDDVVDGVNIVDGEVRVNLLPLTTRALGALQEIGLFGDVVLPEMDRAGVPDDQRAELEAALGRDLRDDFGTPVVFRSDSLDELGDTVQMVQDLLLLARRVFWLFLVVGAAFGAASIWLARNRWRAAAYVVAGLFGGALLFRIVGGIAGDRVPDALDQPGAQETAAQIISGLETSLNQTLLAFCALALLGLLAAAWAVHGHPEWMRRRARSAS